MDWGKIKECEVYLPKILAPKLDENLITVWIKIKTYV